MAKLSGFKDQERLFACPICQAPMHLDLSSLVCQNRHTFNIAKQGFVNFLRQTKGDKNYDMASFEKRSQILAAGYYDPILEVISERLRDLPEHSHVLDVACGEGYYSRQLAQEFDKDFMAFDLSKDSILLAARQNPHKNVAWFVGDLAQLPLREHSIDVILDIFSPANYQEFGRLLSDHGLIFKVIPHEDHLKEFRQLLPEVQAYSNQDVLEHFQESCDLLERVTIAKTWSMPSEHVQTFAEMTPLFFHANKDTLDLTSVTQLTVAGELLIGRIRDDKQS